MRTTVVVGLMLGLGLALPPAANAAGHTFVGGCFLATVEHDSLTSGVTIGAIGDVSATYDGDGKPTNAMVTCWVDVNGSPAPGTAYSYSGFGGQAGLDDVHIAVSDNDVVSLCQQVFYVDATPPSNCTTSTTAAVTQTAGEVIEVILSVTDPPQLDAIICPVFGPLDQLIGGGVPGVVEIGPDGDISIGDPFGVGGLNPAYDCPPYETDPQRPPSHGIHVWLPPVLSRT
ncbi:MAG: hypothetical protein QOG34_2379 [Frankiaceae bacterium]|jgi:hypothetical protein|nr:hypothetical protein [Frankiaceae bacterium]